MNVVTLRVETRSIIRILLTITVFGAVVLLINKVSSALTFFAISAFLAIALNPPVTWLANHLPGHSRILATAIAYVAVLSALGSLAYVAAQPVYSQTQSFVNNLPSYISQVTSTNGAARQIINRYDLQDEVDDLIRQVQGETGTIAQGVGSSFVSGVSNVFNGSIALLTVLVLTFLMLIEGPAWIRRVWSIYADKRRLARDKRLLGHMYKVVTSFVNGQVLVAAINATGVMIVLFVLSRIFDTVPMNAILPLTGIIFVAALIPMFGATIGAIIAGVVLLFNSLPAALIFLGYYIIYQQIENNVIQPLVQSRTIQLSALMVFTAALIGIWALGILGAIMAIPLAGCIRVLVADFFEHRQDYTSHGHTPRVQKTVVIETAGK